MYHATTAKSSLGLKTSSTLGGANMWVSSTTCMSHVFWSTQRRTVLTLWPSTMSGACWRNASQSSSLWLNHCIVLKMTWCELLCGTLTLPMMAGMKRASRAGGGRNWGVVDSHGSRPAGILKFWFWVCSTARYLKWKKCHMPRSHVKCDALVLFHCLKI